MHAQREMKPCTALLELYKGLWKLMFERLCILQTAKPDCLSPAPKKPLLVHSLVLHNFLQCYSISLNVVLGI